MENNYSFEKGNTLKDKVDQIHRSGNIVLKKNGLRKCCSCSNIYEITNFYSKGKGKLSSNCKNCDKIKLALYRESRKNDPKLYCNSIVASLRYRAKTEKVPFNLTGDLLYNQLVSQDFYCYYTKEFLDFTLKLENPLAPHINFPSVDRLIPCEGYVEGNIAWALWGVNRAKNNLTVAQFIDFCKKVVKTHA